MQASKQTKTYTHTQAHTDTRIKVLNCHDKIENLLKNMFEEGKVKKEKNVRTLKRVFDEDSVMSINLTILGRPCVCFMFDYKCARGNKKKYDANRKKNA